MPELLIKSEQNFKAASLLLDNEFYASSIHCSYYSCFQKLKHVISHAYNCDYNELEVELKDLNRKRAGGSIASHEYLIDFKLLQLIKRENADHRLINKLNDLKKYRNKSDYENVSIVYNKSKSVFDLSKNVLNCLDELL